MKNLKLFSLVLGLALSLVVISCSGGGDSPAPSETCKNCDGKTKPKTPNNKSKQKAIAAWEPVLNNNCPQKNNIIAPAGSNGHVFSQNCKILYILPPKSGEIELTGMIPFNLPSDTNLCQKLENSTSKNEQNDLIYLLKTESGSGSVLITNPIFRLKNQYNNINNTSGLRLEVIRSQSLFANHGALSIRDVESSYPADLNPMTSVSRLIDLDGYQACRLNPSQGLTPDNLKNFVDLRMVNVYQYTVKNLPALAYNIENFFKEVDRQINLSGGLTKSTLESVLAQANNWSTLINPNQHSDLVKTLFLDQVIDDLLERALWNEDKSHLSFLNGSKSSNCKHMHCHLNSEGLTLLTETLKNSKLLKDFKKDFTFKHGEQTKEETFQKIKLYNLVFFE